MQSQLLRAREPKPCFGVCRVECVCVCVCFLLAFVCLLSSMIGSSRAGLCDWLAPTISHKDLQFAHIWLVYIFPQTSRNYRASLHKLKQDWAKQPKMIIALGGWVIRYLRARGKRRKQVRSYFIAWWPRRRGATAKLALGRLAGAPNNRIEINANNVSRNTDAGHDKFRKSPILVFSKFLGVNPHTPAPLPPSRVVSFTALVSQHSENGENPSPPAAFM